jgi:hypothetical protein
MIKLKRNAIQKIFSLAMVENSVNTTPGVSLESSATLIGLF